MLITKSLIPKDDADENNAILEVRAGEAKLPLISQFIALYISKSDSLQRVDAILVRKQNGCFQLCPNLWGEGRYQVGTEPKWFLKLLSW